MLVCSCSSDKDNVGSYISTVVESASAVVETDNVGSVSAVVESVSLLKWNGTLILLMLKSVNNDGLTDCVETC